MLIVFILSLKQKFSISVSGVQPIGLASLEFQKIDLKVPHEKVFSSDVIISDEINLELMKTYPKTKTYSEVLNDYLIYKLNDLDKSNQTFIDKEIPSFHILSEIMEENDVNYSNLFSKSALPGYMLLKSATLLSENSLLDKYTSVKINNTPFRFLWNAKRIFTIYFHDDSYGKTVLSVLNSHSPRSSSIPISLIFSTYFSKCFYICVLILIFGIIFIYVNQFKKQKLKWGFWILKIVKDESQNLTCEIIKGVPENEENSRIFFYIKRSCLQSIYSGQIVTNVIGVHNGDYRNCYQRIMIIPIKNSLKRGVGQKPNISTTCEKAIALFWEDLLPDCKNYNLNVQTHFHSTSFYCTESPILRFSSFRDYRPFHLDLHLYNHTTTIIDIPGLLMSVFQAQGPIVEIVSIVYKTIKQILHEHPFSISNYKTVINIGIKELNITRLMFIVNRQKIAFQYAKEGFSPFDSDKVFDNLKSIHVPNFFRVFSNMEWFQSDNVKGNTFLCEESSSTLQTTLLMTIEESAPESIKIMGLSFFANFINFMYFIADIKETELHFDRVAQLTTCMPYSGLFVADEQSQQIISQINRTTPHNITTLSELDLLYKDQYGAKDYDNHQLKIEKDLSKTRKIFQYPISIRDHTISYSIGYNKEKNLISRFFDNVTLVKQKEDEVISRLRDIEKIFTRYKLGHFSIINSKAYLSEYQGHKYDPPLSEEQFVYNDQWDINNIRDVIDQNLVRVLRFVLDDSAENEFFLVASDGQSNGYFFPINSFLKPNLDKLSQITVFQDPEPLYFWEVKNDQVTQIFGLPTIWDYLNVSPNTKFSSLSNFIDNQRFCEYFHKFTSDYTKKGMDVANVSKEQLKISLNENLTSDFFFDENRLIFKVQINSPEGKQWVKLDFSRKLDGSLICVAFVSQKLMQLRKAKEETIEKYELLLSSGKIELWTFSDTKDEMEPLTDFIPGLTHRLMMNWSNASSFIDPFYMNQFKDKLEKAFENEEYVEIDVPSKFKQGKWLSMRGKVPIGEKILYGICIDITEIREAFNKLEEEKTKAEEANRAKTVFLANMSHEIRTPMNGIFGTLDVLALQDLTPEQKLIVDSIRSSSSQLMRLLDDTLNISKIEHQKIEFNPSIFNLIQIIEPICISTAARARLNHLKLNVIIDKNFPILIYSDYHLIVQVLNNLFSNALKFTKSGSITLSLNWSDKESGRCTLSVSDTGIGISKEQQKIIFERFQQADRQTARYYGGTGLGLSLVQEIANFFGGSVSVQSELNEGTTFTIELPMESRMVPYSPPFSDHKQHFVLLKITDEILLKMLQEWLQYLKYSPKVFTNTSEISEWRKEGIVHAIIVEGQHEDWSKIKVATKDRIPVCSLVEPGETAFFRFSLAKPIMIHRFIAILNGFRYGTIEKTTPRTTVKPQKFGKKVLVVEDNKQNQFVMMKILENLDCTYKIADNGSIALDLLEKESFDLVFMDCQMPIMGGMEATKKIRRSGKIYSSIPIVALTASAIEGDEAMCHEAGMDGFLAKPVRMSHIVDALTKFSAFTHELTEEEIEETH